MTSTTHPDTAPASPAELDDVRLRALFDDLSVPALLATCVHLLPAGRRREILDGPLRPAGVLLNEWQGFMAPEDQAAARDLAADVVRDWCQRGCPGPEPLDGAELHELMSFVTGAEVAPEYVPMMAEELALDGSDAGAPAPVDGAQDYPVVVIGCGMSGLLAALRLRQAGHPVTVVEKNDGPGGTWRENTYPGARVDVANHYYCYSFAPNEEWSQFFATQPELLAYFERVAEEHDVPAMTRFGVEVTDCTWHEEQGRWQVTLDDGSTLQAAIVVSAVGQLNRPSIPDVPGTFDGPAFHTSRWRDDVELTGQDVVMIGAGATGFQLAPAIADRVGSLTVIQRSAQWMFPNPGYHDEVGPGVGWAMRHLPAYGRWFRFLIAWGGLDQGLAAAEVDPDWADQEHSVSEISDLVRVMFTEWIESQVEDPELRAKVVPTYPPTGKRTLQDNGSWLQTLQRDNVELVRAGVERLEADAVVDTEGGRHRADVIVWATGFKPLEFLTPLTVHGVAGVEVNERWAGHPRAHLGLTVPGFPNFFCLYGPGTNLASGGSIVAGSEYQVAYLLEATRMLVERRARAVEITPEAFDGFVERQSREMSTKVWASPHIEHNYYRDEHGEVPGLNPFRLVDYWAWTRQLESGDFTLR
ncbi:NAD(P)/FAD-dependent oxidoreductase [Nocardioides acrostichi]|uniref:FAD-dependent oxidoreductase n=1 Tax=Nocardioides acrostichi TaxID=2784339 RepID=A0A930V0S7_9ACTN|nr:NAD(P)/FAD-dependent oxidoreductase [Nocardioides acrostichi]MBF4161627.1 FAD-dependent oxidoreductase [Nocardioides acrostichi]